MDRRKKSRIDVQLTCCVNAGVAQTTPVQTITENVSRSGMLMLWASQAPLPRVSGQLSLDVMLPENSEFGPRVMRCRTEVIRVAERENGEHEVALRVLDMRFIKPGERTKSTAGKRTRKTRDLATMPPVTTRVN